MRLEGLWEALHPRLESDDAGQDGLALKKMLAACSDTTLRLWPELLKI